MVSFSIQVVLAGTLTGIQGDIRCKILGDLSSKILTCNLSWNWPNRRLSLNEVSSWYSFIEMKCTMVTFPKYVIGSSLVDIVKIRNNSEIQGSQVKMM